MPGTNGIVTRDGDDRVWFWEGNITNLGVERESVPDREVVDMELRGSRPDLHQTRGPVTDKRACTPWRREDVDCKSGLNEGEEVSRCSVSEELVARSLPRFND